MDYINTDSLWEEMSGIASQAISEIENVLEQNNYDEISVGGYGTLYYDKAEDEAYIRSKNGEEAPLREENTHDILNIADIVNDYVNDYNEKHNEV